jgi:8-oxo-dGTP pyrophosphatase MutT (NUDIX family)
MSDAPTPQAPRAAASVILLRERAGEAQVYLLRRHRKASFMSSSYVFPGGIADEGEVDPRHTAARELFEEAGILLTSAETSADERQRWRDALNVDKAPFDSTLGNVPLALGELHYYAHWITPTIEKRRYSAQFFVAVCPPGQEASPDNRETVDEIWVSPAEALERSGELRLPPPQLRTFHELLEPAREGIAGILAAAEAGAAHKHPILPRACATQSGFALLLPWDPGYESEGQGDALPMPADHPLAWGPSRFVMEAGGWKHLGAEDGEG